MNIIRWPNLHRDRLTKAILEAKTPAVTIVGKTWLLHVTEVLCAKPDENPGMIGGTIRHLKDHVKKVMEMLLGNQIAPDSLARAAVYRNFQQNLTGIVRAGLDSGAELLLSSVAVNLRDCPPFAPLHADGASPVDCAACDTNYQAGLAAQRRGNFIEAAADFERAAKFDPSGAALQYQWAETLLNLTNFPAASVHYQLACDNDALPFRATSQINDIIRATGRQLAGPNLDFFDAAGVLRTNARTDICGQETFYEHVHFNIDGNYRPALAWAGELENPLPESFRKGETKEWASQVRCERLLGLTDWDRCNVNTELAAHRQRPPLSSLPNNGPILRELEDQIADLRQGMQSPDDRTAARNVYVEALRFSPDDYSTRANYAEFLTDVGDTSAAIQQWQQLRETFRQAYAPCYELGRLAADQRQFEQAKPFLRTTLAMRPSFAPGWFDLGSVYAATTNYDLAITAFDQAVRFNPKNAHIGSAQDLPGR